MFCSIKFSGDRSFIIDEAGVRSTDKDEFITEIKSKTYYDLDIETTVLIIHSTKNTRASKSSAFKYYWDDSVMLEQLTILGKGSYFIDLPLRSRTEFLQMDHSIVHLCRNNPQTGLSLCSVKGELIGDDVNLENLYVKMHGGHIKNITVLWKLDIDAKLGADIDLKVCRLGMVEIKNDHTSNVKLIQLSCL